MAYLQANAEEVQLEVIRKSVGNKDEIAPELTGHGLPLRKCEAYNRVYEQRCGSS